jgi:hypothetical protein
MQHVRASPLHRTPDARRLARGTKIRVLVASWKVKLVAQKSGTPLARSRPAREKPIEYVVRVDGDAVVRVIRRQIEHVTGTGMHRTPA